MGAGGDLDAVGAIGAVGGGDDGVLVEDVAAAHVEAVDEQEDEVGVGVGGGLAAADNPARSPLGVLGHHVGVQDDTVLQGGGVRLPSKQLPWLERRYDVYAEIPCYRSGGDEEGESNDGLHGAGLDYSKGSGNPE